MKTLVAVGAAFLDIIVRCSSPDLTEYGKELNENRFLTKEQYLCVKKQMKNPSVIPGGSAANATAIFAQLGGNAVFAATIGQDNEGKIWHDSMTRLKISAKSAISHEEPTGGCLVFVHPNGQRSMRTYAGSEKVANNNLENIPIDSESIVFLEGYVVKNPQKPKIYLSAIDQAKKDGAHIVVSAADPVCVKEQRPVFIELLEKYVDMIIMNEEEACELANGNLQDCIRFIRKTGKSAVITLGASGAIAIQGNNIWYCHTRNVNVVDTTGAGDGFAGGFLYGLATGFSIPECLQLGCYMAAEVVSRFGARIDGQFSNVVKNQNYKQLTVRQFEGS